MQPARAQRGGEQRILDNNTKVAWMVVGATIATLAIGVFCYREAVNGFILKGVQYLQQNSRVLERTIIGALVLAVITLATALFGLLHLIGRALRR